MIYKKTQHRLLSQLSNLKARAECHSFRSESILGCRGQGCGRTETPKKPLFGCIPILQIQTDVPQTALGAQSLTTGVVDRLIKDLRHTGTEPDSFSIFQGEWKRRLEVELYNILIIRSRQVSVEAEILSL